MIGICKTTDDITLDNDVDLIIQQIDNLFDTSKGEVIGQPNYGTDFERFLYDLNVGSMEVATYIKDTIYNNVDLFDWVLDVEVRFMVGVQNDIMIIGVKFSKNNESYSHVYKVSEYKEDIDWLDTIPV